MKKGTSARCQCRRASTAIIIIIITTQIDFAKEKCSLFNSTTTVTKILHVAEYNEVMSMPEMEYLGLEMDVYDE